MISTGCDALTGPRIALLVSLTALINAMSAYIIIRTRKNGNGKTTH